MKDFITLLIAVLGSGGLCSIITAIFSRRKYKAESLLIEAEAEECRKNTERASMDYIHEQLKEITETYKNESRELREMNRELTERITTLENRINRLMEWVVNDDSSYRSWLENKLKDLDPNIELPVCKPAPLDDNNNNNSET